jgi:hypothetical protein
MKLRRRQVTLVVIAVLALGLAGWIWVIHYRAKRAVADYRQQLVAAGEKLTVDELIRDSVPPEQNSAGIFSKAASLLNRPWNLLSSNPPPAMRMVAPGKAMVGWAQPDIRDYSEGATNTWAETQAGITELFEGLVLLHQMIDRPTLDFGLNYEQGFSLLLPNLAQPKNAAQRLSAAALCDLHRGDTASATMNVRAMLALAKGLADERLVISQLVRIAIAAITSSVTWEVLQSPDVTDAQLAALQRDWAELEFLLATEQALAMERAMSEVMVTQMRNSGAEFRRAVSGSRWSGSGSASSADNWFDQAMEFAKNAWAQTRLKTKETAWRVAWSYPDQLRALKGRQVLLETTRVARTNGCFHEALRLEQSRLAALGIRRTADDVMFDVAPAELDFRSLLSQSVVSLDRILYRLMRIETVRQMTLTAIALQRYKLRHGAGAPDLAALVPEFLPAIPRDPVDSEPLRYRANSDGSYLLYSVGQDGKDDAGNPKPADEQSKSLLWQGGRDWVWPQPATTGEIQDYFESQTKKSSPARYGVPISNAPSFQPNDTATNGSR